MITCLIIEILGYKSCYTFANEAHVIQYFRPPIHHHKDLLLTITNIHLQFHQYFSALKYQSTRDSGRHYRATI